MKLGWIVGALVWATPAAAETWNLEAFGGNAYNFDSRLRIAQDGGFSESLTAKYETRGFRFAPDGGAASAPGRSRFCTTRSTSPILPPA